MANIQIERVLAALFDRWNALGVADGALAVVAGVPPRSLARWREGTYPQIAARARVEALGALLNKLLRSFGEDDDAALRVWLHADNRYLGGLKPIEALMAGRFDRVEAALIALDEGFFT